MGIDLKPIREALENISKEGWYGNNSHLDDLFEILDEHKVAADKALAHLDAIEQQPTDTVVDLEAAGFALYRQSGWNEWKQESEDQRESWRSRAKTCAEAWGLPWK